MAGLQREYLVDKCACGTDLHRYRHTAAARLDHVTAGMGGASLWLSAIYTDPPRSSARSLDICHSGSFTGDSSWRPAKGMGYGDFKLLAALGAWLGWQILPLIILLSSLVGAIVGIVLIVVTKRGRGTSLFHSAPTLQPRGLPSSGAMI